MSTTDGTNATGVTPTLPTASQTTVSTTNNFTTGLTTKTPDTDMTGPMLAVIGTVVLVATLLSLSCWYFRKHGKPWISFTRVRRSSTSSSRRTLETAGPADMTSDLGYEEEVTSDMFTIDDDEEERDDEGYLYDEVFGQSPFRDRRTNSAIRDLTEHDRPGGNRHDVDFETLGIRMDDYKIDPIQKFT